MRDMNITGPPQTALILHHQPGISAAGVVKKRAMGQCQVIQACRALAALGRGPLRRSAQALHEGRSPRKAGAGA